MVMKPLYLFSLLIFVVPFSSCEKHTQSPLPVTNGKVLPGVWEIRAMVGCQLNCDPKYFKPGNARLVKFTQTEFVMSYKDSVVRSGSYAISPGTGIDLNTGRKIDQFVFNNEPAESFELKNDTLKIYQGAIFADGVILMYVKIDDSY